jgi:hypothetical protein
MFEIMLNWTFERANYRVDSWEIHKEADDAAAHCRQGECHARVPSDP